MVDEQHYRNKTANEQLQLNYSKASKEYATGSLVEVRGDVWKVRTIEHDGPESCLTCIGVEGISRGREAKFLTNLDNVTTLRPTEIQLQEDTSAAFSHTKLFLEGAFRTTAPTGSTPLLLSRAAIDDLPFQHEPVKRILNMPRSRLLIGDDVGLGKTLEAGIVASELILRGRARRILVVTTRAMLVQFQKEFWTRFAIPLARLDSGAIKRMKNQIPAHYNVFDQFERCIVSIDTLKSRLDYRTALENSHWDLVIIDEAHNTAVRDGSASLRAQLAKLLSRRTDSLLLLTATPHDGSMESFASLIKMLDPTRIPDDGGVKREDIEDLVVRRFRATPNVVDSLKDKVPQRKLVEIKFTICSDEDLAYKMIADMQLDLDGTITRAFDLFRTTLAKSIFSSPMACLETVKKKIVAIKKDKKKTAQADLTKLKELKSKLKSINADSFGKYQQLVKHLRDTKWLKHNERDRIVIFSERLETLRWLEVQLKQDFNLNNNEIGRVDGARASNDEYMQQVLENFGQAKERIRILLASDMASEGLNLHFHCCRLIHFDLPWSLIRFMQRNGRIDRYGQDRQPVITYFIGVSSHKTVQDMWVLDKLIEKDKLAQEGVGDPAVFLGQGDADKEEQIVADYIIKKNGAQELENLMNSNVANSVENDELSVWSSVLCGTFQSDKNSNGKESGSIPTPQHEEFESAPKVFLDTFDFVKAALQTLASKDIDPLLEQPIIDNSARTIRFALPNSMRSTDNFGYSSKDNVDDRYMPKEALPKNQQITLTDNRETIRGEIENAKFKDNPWPEIQYLWDVHPIIGWLGDSVEQLFDRRSVPLLGIKHSLDIGVHAILMHGVVANRGGSPIIDCWAVARVERKSDGPVSLIQPVSEFFKSIHFLQQLPNRRGADPDSARKALAFGVDTFCNHLSELREKRRKELECYKKTRITTLDEFKERFEQQKLSKSEQAVKSETNLSAKRRKAKRYEALKRDVEEIFTSERDWLHNRFDMPEDEPPSIEIKAVFQGV